MQRSKCFCRLFIGKQDIRKSSAAVSIAQRTIQGHEERLHPHGLGGSMKRGRPWLSKTVKAPHFAQGDMKVLVVEYSTRQSVTLLQLDRSVTDRIPRLRGNVGKLGSE